jgi:hypothetical protein
LGSAAAKQWQTTALIFTAASHSAASGGLIIGLCRHTSGGSLLTVASKSLYLSY